MNALDKWNEELRAPKWWWSELGLLMRIHRVRVFRDWKNPLYEEQPRNISRLFNAGLIKEIAPDMWVLTTAGHAIYERTFHRAAAACDSYTRQKFKCKSDCFCEVKKRRQMEVEACG